MPHSSLSDAGLARTLPYCFYVLVVSRNTGSAQRAFSAPTPELPTIHSDDFVSYVGGGLYIRYLVSTRSSMRNLDLLTEVALGSGAQ